MNSAVPSLSIEFDESTSNCINYLANDGDDTDEKKDDPDDQDDNNITYRLVSQHPSVHPPTTTTITGVGLPLSHSVPPPQTTPNCHNYGKSKKPNRLLPSLTATLKDWHMRQCGSSSSNSSNNIKNNNINHDRIVRQRTSVITDNEEQANANINVDDDRMAPSTLVHGDHTVDKAIGFVRPNHHNNDRENDLSIDEGQEKKQVERKESLLWRSRLFVGKIVNHEYVQISIIVLILINALMMGIGTMTWVTENTKINNVFTKIDRGCLVIFTIEVSMQLYYLGIAF
jgi:hypothetical protein